MLNKMIKYARLIALIPFGLCVLFLRLLGKIFGLTYKQISVVFNLWIQGAVLALTGVLPFGITCYKMLTSFTPVYMVLAIVFLCYGAIYVYAFIKMLHHYHLPFDDAFDLCVEDLQALALRWHTTYQIVNLLIFIIFYLILLGLNILMCNYLVSL